MSTASCTKSGSPKWDSDTATRDGAPSITVPCGAAPKELGIDDLKVGDGNEVTDGTVAVVDYIGANYSNGVVFDASYGRAPFPVTVGAGQVIKGWDQGLVGMKVGGRRQLVIPPDLGYGPQANGDIPANETLIFVVELRAVITQPENPAPVPGGTVTELVSTDEIVGTGDAVEDGDTVTVHYIGVHGGSGEVFDASWTRGQPFDVQVGAGMVIAGWDQGLVGMKVGGRRRLEVPGDLAYGSEGRPPTIEPNETLVFLIDVLGIS